MTSILELPHGVHLGVPEAVYHQRVLGLVSKHALDLVRKTPAHYKTWIDGAESEDTEAFAFGRAAHCSILEPDRFSSTYVVEPAFGDCRKTENKKARDAWRLEHEGALLLSAKDHRACVAMGAAIRRHSRASKLLSGGSTEVTARWRDPETGLEGKCRADFHDGSRDLIVDLKTTESAEESASARSFASYGYARQDALYRRGFAAAGVPVRAFIFICIEKVPPYGIAVWTLDDEDRADALEDVRDDMATLADCIEHDSWPCYPEEIRTLQLPTWARRTRRAA